MADPKLQIRGGGGEGAVIQTLRKGGGQSQKKFSRLLGPQFGLKIRGAGPPGPSLGSATTKYSRTPALQTLRYYGQFSLSLAPRGGEESREFSLNSTRQEPA